MSILNVVLAVMVGIFSGAVVGTVFGFSAASHVDVLRGVRPNTTNRLILFLARPTSELGVLEAVIFIVLMCAWLAAFFGLCALPAIAAHYFSLDAATMGSLVYGLFIIAALAGKRFGAHAWKVISWN